MTTQKQFKRRVRARMAKTGERYTAARRHVDAQRDRAEADLQPAEPAKGREIVMPEPDAPTAEAPDLSAAYELASEDKVRAATGQGWQAWLDLLDAWGARQRNHTETADFLVTQHGVPGWYAQTITNGYERTRGLRIKHQQADGFTVYASRTVAVPIDALFEAFVDDAMRRRWLTDGTMSTRTSQPGKTARFDWGDGSTRVMVTFEAKGPTKSTAYVVHERLADPSAAEAAKSDWKARLAALKTFLASPSTFA